MIFRTTQVLFIALIACSCNLQAQNTGLKIEYGPNLGTIDKFSAGNFIHITATITNDSTIPINLQIAISDEHDFPDSCGDFKYKVFLLPKEMTPDSATLYNNITNTVTEEVDNFLNRCLENPYVLNKTLEPNEYSVITIGTLFPTTTKCAALPRAIFAVGDDHNFQRCDSRMDVDKAANPQITLGVKLDFYSGKHSIPETCILHSCGEISYPRH